MNPPDLANETLPTAREEASARHQFLVLYAEPFRVLDEHLWFAEQQGQGWLCSPDHPTIADLACFPYVMLSEEGGISRLPYPAIRRWTDRVKRIPGFTTMAGVFGAGEPAG